tara:strand:+ start:2752 stop:3564 length:813 start_codon:yes stop_codon:yes gene_type:complete
MTTKKTSAEVEAQPIKIKTPPEPKKPQWEIRDRAYFLKENKKPLVFTIPTKHSSKKPLLWFDEKEGMQRELRYATNMNSPFVDEQKGEATLGRIVFRDGQLFVPKEQVSLQKLMSMYHPLRDQLYYEYNPVQDSEDELDYIEMEIDALILAKQLDIEHIEAILRVEYGEAVDRQSSSELKRDILVFAKRNPMLFMELAQDENVELRNIGVKATQQGIIRLSSDQRTFTYGETDRKLMSVPFDEHPYSALAAWFRTDEGMEVFKNLEKRLK